MISIIKLRRASKSAVRSINALIRQLSASASPVSLVWLKKLLRDKKVHLLVLMNSRQIIGMGTVVIFDTLLGRRGRIEDVVVHERYRGRGLGEKLVRKLIAIAKKAKVQQVQLTSRPERRVANALYQKLGFKHYKTNVYKLKL